MRVEPFRLASLIEDELGAVGDASGELASLEGAISEVSSRIDYGDSEAYRSYRRYLRDVRLQHDYLLALRCDLRADLSRVTGELSWGDTVVDSEVLRARIAARRDAIRRLGSVSDDLTPFVPLAALAVDALADAYRDEVYRLQDRLDRLEAYGRDASLYGVSSSYAGALGASARAMGSVVKDPATGAYDLSGVDLSWVPAYDEEYWRRHNALVLERWFILDEDGNYVGVRPEAAEEALGLFLGGVEALTQPNRFSEFIDALSPDEKYLLILTMANLAPEVYERSVEAAYSVGAGNARDLLGVMEQVEDGRWGELGLGAIPALGLYLFLSQVLSFRFDGGIMYSDNVEGSIQERAGYSDLVDLCAPVLGMDIDSEVVTFVYDGKEYRLQKWDGSYGAGLGYGGEVGLYCRDLPDSDVEAYHPMEPEEIRENLDTLTSAQVESICATYDTVDGDDQPGIEISVTNPMSEVDGIRRNAGNTYWNYTATVVPDESGEYTKDNLYVWSRLDCSANPGLCDAAEEALLNAGIPTERSGDTLAVTWRE